MNYKDKYYSTTMFWIVMILWAVYKLSLFYSSPLFLLLECLLGVLEMFAWKCDNARRTSLANIIVKNGVPMLACTVILTAITGIRTPRFPALPDAFNTGAGDLSVALSPPRPNWTNSSSNLVSSSKRADVPRTFAAMFARAFNTAPDTCL